MPYRAPAADHEFLLRHIVGYDRLARTDSFAEADADTAAAILGEAGKLGLLRQV